MTYLNLSYKLEARVATLDKKQEKIMKTMKTQQMKRSVKIRVKNWIKNE
jgi:predicted nucleic acid-binding protein